MDAVFNICDSNTITTPQFAQLMQLLDRNDPNAAALAVHQPNHRRTPAWACGQKRTGKHRSALYLIWEAGGAKALNIKTDSGITVLDSLAKHDQGNINGDETDIRLTARCVYRLGGRVSRDEHDAWQAQIKAEIKAEAN
jgi:hypothetical protein